mgnify:CR=1 FL=1
MVGRVAGRQEAALRAFRFGHPADSVAKAIVTAVHRNQDLVPVGIESQLAYRLLRFAPGPIQGAIARAQQTTARVALRVNPDVDAKSHPHISTGLRTNKFGVPIDRAPQAYRTAAALPGLDPDGRLIITSDEALARGDVPGRVTIVGAGLGGLVSAMFGAETAFIVDAVSFLVSAALLSSIRRGFSESRTETTEHPSIIEATRETWRFARRDHRVLSLLAVKFGFGAAAGLLAASALLGVWGDDLALALLGSLRLPLSGAPIVSAAALQPAGSESGQTSSSPPASSRLLPTPSSASYPCDINVHQPGAVWFGLLTTNKIGKLDIAAT